MNREKIIEAISEELQKSLKSLQDRVNTVDDAADLDEEAVRDYDDFSQQDQYSDTRHLLTRQLHAAENDLANVKKYAENSYDSVAPGAIVITDERIFMADVSFPPFEIDGKQIASFSTEAPVYQENEGKQKGDTFVMGDQEIKIENIL
ncbi:MAG: hypothetical protein EAS48_09605 [Chryseobacterium sp.]|nr:MAG: hypothetical protein EAS48_09605 [Chryseobacterium sp.]